MKYELLLLLFANSMLIAMETQVQVIDKPSMPVETATVTSFLVLHRQYMALQQTSHKKEIGNVPWSGPINRKLKRQLMVPKNESVREDQAAE